MPYVGDDVDIEAPMAGNTEKPSRSHREVFGRRVEMLHRAMGSRAIIAASRGYIYSEMIEPKTMKIASASSPCLFLQEVKTKTSAWYQQEELTGIMREVHH